MADSTSGPEGTPDSGSQTPPPNQQTPPSGQQTSALSYMLANKLETLLWMTRVFTVVSTILFILPLFGGNPNSFYQRALISSAATSALRLHQRLPNFQFSREFFGRMFLEDSCHYLFFALIFMNTYPITMSLVPVFLFALLHATTFTKTLLNLMGQGSLQFAHNLVNKLVLQQTNILRFIACTEVFLMPAIIFMIFIGKAMLLLPFVYYRFLTLRYASRRNPYCRLVFTDLRQNVEVLCSKPQCPAFVRNMSYKGIALICRLAPDVAPASS
ncbi:transmembrane protein 33-like [Liolophura sinensis]|uniref:transmembrane protein 33-like n=1 Tax=Liolophura sinensis TaxID=3198878 RepID=UPI003158B36E